jgi:hypothetical protein
VAAARARQDVIEGEVVTRAAVLARTKFLSETTLGSFISKLGLRTARS